MPVFGYPPSASGYLPARPPALISTPKEIAKVHLSTSAQAHAIIVDLAEGTAGDWFGRCIYMPKGLSPSVLIGVLIGELIGTYPASCPDMQ